MSNFLKIAFATAVFASLCDSARASDLFGGLGHSINGLSHVRSYDDFYVRSSVQPSEIISPFFKSPEALYGVARLDQGRLIAIPFGEEVDWMMLDARLPVQFEPISVNRYLDNVPEIPLYGHDTSHKIDEIRLTARDQKHDFLIVYALPCAEKNTVTAEARLIDIYTGEILSQVSAEADEIEFNIGILADRVGEMIQIHRRQTA